MSSRSIKVITLLVVGAILLAFVCPATVGALGGIKLPSLPTFGRETPAPVAGLTADDIRAIVSQELAKVEGNTFTKAETAQLLADAVAGLNKGLSEAEILALIQAQIAAAPGAAPIVPAPVVPAPVVPSTNIYTVQYGDSLWKIANMHGTDLAGLLAMPGNEWLSAADFKFIVPGDKIVVPFVPFDSQLFFGSPNPRNISLAEWLKNPGLTFNPATSAVFPEEWDVPTGQKCHKWILPFPWLTTTVADLEKNLTGCTRWFIAPGTEQTVSFKYQTIGPWDHATLGAVNHDPVLAARSDPDVPYPPLPFLVIEAVPGSYMDVVYETGATCTNVQIAEIRTDIGMTIRMVNPPSGPANAHFGIGPGGRAPGITDPTWGNDAPAPTCHP